MSRSYGLISDIHANDVSLKIALEQLNEQGVDEIICAGDIIGYGGCPNETISLLEKNKVVSILGNHDFYILANHLNQNKFANYTLLPELMELPREMKFREIALIMFEFTKKIISHKSIRWLSKLPIALISAEKSIFTIHGAPPTTQSQGALIEPKNYMYALNKYLFPWDQENLSLSCFVQPLETMILGHTHMQFAHQSRSPKEQPIKTAHPCLMKYELFPIRKTFDKRYPLLINPGSIGQSRDEIDAPGYAIIKFKGSKRLVTWYRFKYDFDEFLNKMRIKGAPEEIFDKDFWRVS